MRAPITLGPHLLYRADCRSVLSAMRPETVDATITDPPFGTSGDDGTSKVQTRSGVARPWEAPSWDRDLPLAWIRDGVRVTRRGGALLVCTDGKRVGDVWREYQLADARPLQVVGWHKSNPPPVPRPTFQSALELAVFGRRQGGNVVYWGGGGATHNVWSGPTVHHTRRAHPTQKPLELMMWLVELLVPPGGLVLDPFAGAGTTLLAAALTGRRCIAVELDEDHVEATVDRYREEVTEGSYRLRKSVKDDKQGGHDDKPM